MSIATKTGDKGDTSLMYGRRVPKTHSRVEAYGSVDELNAALGFARAVASEAGAISAQLTMIQAELVLLMGELATAAEDSERYRKDGYQLISAEHVDRLTKEIEELEKDKSLYGKGWATPGGTLLSAALDVARTTCRRAERRVAALGEAEGSLNPELLRYLNRLSDLCWLLARYVEKGGGGESVERGGGEKGGALESAAP